jgi:hypothetical protein
VRVHRHHGPDGGSPIVLLHGRNATMAMWAPNVAALATAHPVYTVDTLGEAGRSVQTLPIRSGADHAVWLEDTERFLFWVSGGPRMDTPVARLLMAGMREYRAMLPMPTYAADDVLRSVRTPVLALLGVARDLRRATRPGRRADPAVRRGAGGRRRLSI